MDIAKQWLFKFQYTYNRQQCNFKIFIYSIRLGKPKELKGSNAAARMIQENQLDSEQKEKS